MADVSVFVCPPPAQGADGACAAGQGAWQNVTLAEPFDPAALDSERLGDAYAAGFVVMGTGLAIIWAARKLLHAIV